MTRTFDKLHTATLLTLAIAAAILFTSPVAAQIISSAADNDMTPSLTDDGWTGGFTTFSPPSPPYFLWSRPGEYHYGKPPDGNNYAGGDTLGTAEISKTITGLTSGTQYAVELYTAVGSLNMSGIPESFFEVTFCGTTQETQHPQRADHNYLDLSHTPYEPTWRPASLGFTANADSCTLSFRARGIFFPPPGGPGIGPSQSAYVFLNAVQVSVAKNSDFGITVSGPSTFLASGNTATVSVTVTNAGPSNDAVPIVTYWGAAVRAGTDGSPAVAGPDAANWPCVSSGSLMRCTRSGPLDVGSVSSFSFDIYLAPGGTGAAPRVSRLAVSPTFMMGNVDLNSENDLATFTTSQQPLACGDGVTGDFKRCDDGNTVAGDGCSASCEWEPNYRCPVTGDCVDIDECAEGTHDCATNALCTNVFGSFTCNCPFGFTGDGVTACDDIDECALGSANCDPNALCTNTSGSFTCACNETELTGDGVTCTDIDECARGTQRCAPGQVCFNVVGGYACHDPCPIGYSEVPPGRCGDLDECALGTSNCDANATCHNTDGWFTCACNPGYCGNGESCSANDTGAACAAICGDGLISGAEACDDGNVGSGDGCNASCGVESGWACADEPSDCRAAACGDGIAVCEETCDDGNTTAGDGCSPDCLIEAGATYACEGAPSVCTQVCSADSALDPQTGKCVSRAGTFACSAQPGTPGNLTPLFALSLLGLLLARRRRQAMY